MFKRIELEWKVLALACLLLLGFAWPVTHLFVSRLSSMLAQSVDEQLEPLLRSQLAEAEGGRRDSLVASVERNRQWQALIPILVREQRYAVLSFSLVLFLGLSAFAFWSLRRLTRPLRNLALAVKRIGRGERADVAVVSGGALGTVEAAVVSLQQELDVLRERARVQGMESAWQDIARVMAHEIKNPLTPIRLTLDTMEERCGTGQAVEAAALGEYLGRVNTQVDALERLVDQFRSFSREPDARPTRVRVRACIDAVAAGVAQSISTQSSGDGFVNADSHLVDQVLLNLWKNAMEAGAGTIRASVHDDGEWVRISVVDDGPGIPRDQLERVWLPYVTLKRGGTGLGLPVVRRLVETMGGSVSLRSPPDNADHGLCVLVRLPRSPEPKMVDDAHTGR
jgi:two-component system nitrogen regulation sensor histidine kinase NtrY